MKRRMNSVAFLLLMTCVCFSCGSHDKKLEKPNVIYILADDLAYGELGCYGQNKIETPHIDGLAKKGMLFTQHYTGAPVCAPARCVLLTGKHAGHAYVRGNDEWRERGDVWNYEAVIGDSSLEGQRPLPEDTETLGKLFQGAGYTTGLVGKWGLGAPHTHSTPNDMGFDFFFGYNCQRQAHTYYPVHLYKNKERVPLGNDTMAPHKHPLPEGADRYDASNYDIYTAQAYSPDKIFEELSQFVSDNKTEPFFLYWASPLPHVALQAPQRWVDYYHEKFGDETPYTGSAYFPCRYPRATYAAMISYLDERVGQLIQQLKDEGIYENTLIIFTSDNGPSYAGGVDADFFNSTGIFQNSYGRTKGFLYEGGIRVPMIASWSGVIAPGSRSDHISGFQDVFPTLSELLGCESSQELDGISFLPTLLGKADKQDEHPYLYWEFPEQGGQIAIRKGDWKVITRNLRNTKETEVTEVYNLAKDPKEVHDLASEQPALIKEYWDIVAKEHVPSRLPNWQYPRLNPQQE